MADEAGILDILPECFRLQYFKLLYDTWSVEPPRQELCLDKPAGCLAGWILLHQAPVDSGILT